MNRIVGWVVYYVIRPVIVKYKNWSDKQQRIYKGHQSPGVKLLRNRAQWKKYKAGQLH